MSHVKEETVSNPAEDAPETEQVRLLDLVPKYDYGWWRVPHLLWLNLKMTVPMMTGYLIGFDSSMLNGIQAVPHWVQDFNNPTGSYLGLLVTMQTIGAIVALPFAPFLTDRLGRRHPIALGSAICLLGTALQGGAPNVATFVAGRFFVGFGGGLVDNASGPLIAEISYPTHRPTLSALAGTTWYIGSIVAAWSTFGTFKIANSWSWRIPSLLQAIPFIYQLGLIYLIPESPRWLISNGRYQKAKEDLYANHAGFAADSGEISPMVELELAEIVAAIEAEKLQNTRSYLDFFATRGNAHRLVIVILMGIMAQWAGNGLLTYLVVVLRGIGITDPFDQNLINAVLVNHLRRRQALLIGVSGMFTSFIMWTVLSAVNQERGYEKSLGIGIVFAIFFFFIWYNMSFAPVFPAYTFEVLTFTLRAKGYMILQIFTYGAGLFNGFANPVALEAIGWKYYIVFAALLATWFVAIWFLFPETSGRTLEEVSEIFDGVEVGRTAMDMVQNEEKGLETNQIEEV
ncbi:general substrate transporter [Dactylonectria estremocensis]|uniref:General substrate transporter n=1 Tax=Dactylonectria estremocensis TaxID=1079267 RepID=A0A9P9IW89_9HYPO|nr:general substrate transporter [Dactylonectria estremocensis]